MPSLISRNKELRRTRNRFEELWIGKGGFKWQALWTCVVLGLVVGQLIQLIEKRTSGPFLWVMMTYYEFENCKYYLGFRNCLGFMQSIGIHLVYFCNIFGEGVEDAKKRQIN